MRQDVGCLAAGLPRRLGRFRAVCDGSGGGNKDGGKRGAGTRRGGRFYKLHSFRQLS